MNSSFRGAILAVSCAIGLLASEAVAQPASGVIYRLFGEVHLASLAQLDEVANALALNDQQKSEIKTINDELNTARMEAFRDAGGDFDSMRQTTVKLYSQTQDKVAAQLDPAQQKRAEEIYVQVNGPTALLSDSIAGKLQLSDEQRKKLADASVDHWYDTFDAFQEMQQMSDEERTAAIEGLIESRNKSLLAVLNDAQKKQWEGLTGEKIEVDLDKLPRLGPQQ
jgi:hypothetical protein